MSQEIIGECPICKEKLVATKLTCKHCGLELSNDFTLSKFNYLKKEELEFIEMYLRCQGNLKELQNQMKLSYPAAKRQFDSVLTSLGYKTNDQFYSGRDAIVNELPIYGDDSNVIQLIKTKLNSYGGKALIPLARGGNFYIYYESFGNGITASNLPNNFTLIWKAFDKAIELLERCSGKAKKGQAMKGPLGDDCLPLDSVEGYVAHYAYGIKKGEYAIRTISALSAILEWAGICINGYGYLELK